MTPTDLAALQRWQKLIAEANARLDERDPSMAAEQVDPETLIGWRPLIDPDRAPAEVPGWYSVGTDADLIEEHLKTHAALYREEIDEAVLAWAETGKRVQIDGEAGLYFGFRLTLGKIVLDGLINAPGKTLAVERCGEPPDPNDQRAFLKWLLITAWDAMGDLQLQCFADDLRNRHPLFRKSRS